MESTTTTSPSGVRASPPSGPGFEHFAFLYESAAEFLGGTLAFIREGVDGGESVLVAVADDKITRLRAALRNDAEQVTFVDMLELGRNPSAIIPAWYRFAESQQRQGVGFRGIGEPIWAERGADELIECERHEALLNVAFSGGPAWKLLCPYDTRSLPAPVIDEARRNHPLLCTADDCRPSDAYRDVNEIPAVFDAPLEPVPDDAQRMDFTVAGLARVRAFVREHARTLAVRLERVEDLVLAVSEVAANAIVHGSGSGGVAIWRRGPTIVCEVRDAGIIRDPLAGRRPPKDDALGGRGLWIANQVCDFVQLRNLTTGSVIRLHLRLG